MSERPTGDLSESFVNNLNPKIRPGAAINRRSVMNMLVSSAIAGTATISPVEAANHDAEIIAAVPTVAPAMRAAEEAVSVAAECTSASQEVCAAIDRYKKAFAFSNM